MLLQSYEMAKRKKKKKAEKQHTTEVFSQYGDSSLLTYPGCVSGLAHSCQRWREEDSTSAAPLVE